MTVHFRMETHSGLHSSEKNTKEGMVFLLTYKTEMRSKRLQVEVMGQSSRKEEAEQEKDPEICTRGP